MNDGHAMRDSFKKFRGSIDRYFARPIRSDWTWDSQRLIRDLWNCFECFHLKMAKSIILVCSRDCGQIFQNRSLNSPSDWLPDADFLSVDQSLARCQMVWIFWWSISSQSITSHHWLSWWVVSISGSVFGFMPIRRSWTEWCHHFITAEYRITYMTT